MLQLRVNPGSRIMNNIKVFSFLVVLMLATPFVLVGAQGETQEPQEAVETAETTNLEDKKLTREERLNAYKAKVTTKLADAQSKRIANRCKASQNKVVAYRKSVNAIVENRTRVYNAIVEKLDTLLIKMQKAELSTVTLETAREDMRADILSMKENFESYDTALADLEEMDCEADPDSFNAALVEARSLQTTLKTQIQEFRQFVAQDIKQIIQDLKIQLSNKTETTQPNESTEE